MESCKIKKLKVGSRHTLSNLAKLMADFGYERSEGELRPGNFNISGGHFIIFSVNDGYPYNVDFFGDKIERIFSFDPKSRKKIKKFSEILIAPNILELIDKRKINIGDYVVHDDHGIGIFSGFEYKKVNSELMHYIVLDYLNNDKLFVPINLKNKISLYIGVGKRRPKLNRLGSQTWKKTYKKTYENIIHLARELLQLYAKRELVKRKSWKIYDDWEAEIKKTFGYDETPDQNKAINDVFSDFQKDIPMDRLVCGDVGFGKTEVAIRAINQAIANGYQAAILVPTTVLCEQHYVTLKERFKNLPVKISHLSRLVESKSQADIIEEIKNGSIDLVVGTHRLFNKNIKYNNLGLLVIDEEQKFGVKDKEKLKKLKTELDVLTLTATPIPRTLFMGLSGMRDMSLIGMAPEGRKEIKTVVKKYDERIISEFINREMNRGGQVYYLHNEVATIEAQKNKLEKMFPGKKINVAHGQMGEKNLAKVMSSFARGATDMLVCSTIIENGLDLSNANTLIVDDADKFGLSQLYQIRGRIGRSPRQAYSLFTYKNKKITDNAFKRLKALVENTELGSGYTIALSDLEIRGGGNILGKEQHGNMEAVGLVLYSKLLRTAVEKIKKNSKIIYNLVANI